MASLVVKIMRRVFSPWTQAVALLALLLPGCSIKKLAVNSLGNALAQGSSTYAEDDDPELVKGAIPFGLKTVESLLAESPRHRGLLYAAASGFTQYAYAFVQQEADLIEERDLARATTLRGRARRLYRRALEYGFRGLEVDFPASGPGSAPTPRLPSRQHADSTSRCSTGRASPGSPPSRSPRQTPS